MEISKKTKGIALSDYRRNIVIYYINEYIEKKMEKNAGSKARNDVEEIFRNFDMQTIQVDRKEHTKGIKMHLNNAATIYYSLKK